MLLGIFVTILAFLGIFGFYVDNMFLLTVGAIAVIIETIIGLISGELKSPLTQIIALIVGYIIVKDFWIGAAIGLCFESVILSVLGWIIIFATKNKMN